MPSDIRTVLVGSSLEPASDVAVTSAAAVARRCGARLHLVHAFALPLGEEPLGSEWGAAELPREEHEAVAERIAAQLARTGLTAGQLAGRRIEVGPPHRALVEAAQGLAADLLVVGPSETAGPFARILGSTADRVVRKATCPVLVARGELPASGLRALLPVDLSSLSADAFGCAQKILERLAGGDERPLAEAFMVLNNLSQKNLAYRFRVQLDEVLPVARRELERFIEQNRATPLEIGRKVRVGEVTEAILEEIEDWRADLVLMGTHGRGGFERFLIGSVAAGIVRQATCSVLVVPPEAALRSALARESAEAAGSVQGA